MNESQAKKTFLEQGELVAAGLEGVACSVRLALAYDEPAIARAGYVIARVQRGFADLPLPKLVIWAGRADEEQPNE